MRALFLRLLLAVAALTVFAGEPVAHAQKPEVPTGKVARIVVVGNKRIEEATVLAAIGLRRGDDLNASKIRRDIKAVYATGFFDDVRVETAPEAEGFVVTFIVKEKPAVRDVHITGNKKINEDDIREVVDIRSFAVLSDAAVKQNVERIRDLYVGKGYYLAEITPQIEPVGDDQVELTFKIQENKKVVVQRIEFTGNDHVPASKIKRYMKTKEGGVLGWLTSKGAFKREDLENDAYTVRSVFLEEGYVDVQVDPPKVYLSPDKRYIYISFHVTEGPKYKIGEVTVQGDFVPEEGLTEEHVRDLIGGRTVFDIEEEEFRQSHHKRAIDLSLQGQGGPKLVTGHTFRLSTLQELVGEITDLYSDQGYAFVNVTPEPSTDPERQIVDIRFEVEKGDKLRIGKINITGNDPTFDKVVRREVLVNEGEIYRGSLVKASRARLERLGYFNKVDVSTPKGEEPGTLDLNLQVSEQPTGSFSLGLGFSSLESFVFTANVSKNNFLGLGYTMSFAVNWSSLRHQVNASLFDPYFLDTRWTLLVSGYAITRQYQLEEYQRGGSLGVGRYLDPRDDVNLRLTYTFEDVGLTSLDAYRVSLLGGDMFRNGLTSKLGFTLDVDKRNNRIFATKGVYASVSAELAGGFRIDDTHVLSTFGGDFDFLETRANLRFFQPLIGNDDTLVFRLNSTAGRIWSTDGRIIPYIHRYRAGGINSVRGYEWYSLGPTVRVLDNEDPIHGDDKLVVGGTETWINNFELEAPIVRQAGILGVVFFDAGNAFGDPWGEGHINPLDLRFSYGGGIRWRSPIGPLRFELGIPIRPLEGERKSVFDFSIGSFF